MELIKGKIVSIINDKTVVINRGKENGVKEGMKFSIKLIFPDLIDPDDPENVVSGLYFTKGKIEINQVYAKMSFCTILPNKMQIANNFSFGLIPQNLTESYPPVENPIITPEYWNIKAGDEIIQIEEKEEKNGT